MSGYLIKHWDNAMCSNFIAGIILIGFGFGFVLNWFVSMSMTFFISFGLLVYDFNVRKNPQ